METEVTRYRLKDKASSTKATILDRMRTWIMLSDRRIKKGKNIIIKPYVEIRMTDNAIFELGDNVIIDNFAFFQLTKPKPILKIGDHVGIGRYSIIAVKGTTKIGKYTQIGPSCQINDHGHNFKVNELIMNQQAIIEDVTIGEDCWLGSGVRILKGVTIGNGSIVGAGSVVTKNIPPNEIWAGVPAVFIKRRT
jgi:acetyltransferase-like isoleucine patch superfamily enzyme